MDVRNANRQMEKERYRTRESITDCFFIIDYDVGH